MSMPFSKRYCLHFGVPAQHFAAAVLRQALYPHARLLYPLITRWNYDFFMADREFISGLASITLRNQFSAEVDEFLSHHANRGLLRRMLRLRVSVSRTRALVDHVFSAPAVARTGT